MAAFRFNFLASPEEEALKPDYTRNATNMETGLLTECKSRFREHHPDISKLLIDFTPHSIQLPLSNETLYYIHLDDIKRASDKGGSTSETCQLIQSTDKMHSDLLPGVYEGGLKIWECTYDLLDYISTMDFKNKRILDLGCGAGLLGIYALLKQAKEVHFQDFNNEVIELYTIPNILLNIQRSSISSSILADESVTAINRCRFFSGDWSYFRPMCMERQMKYDVILTSETIYNPLSHSKLLSVFYELLDKEGIILVAAKTHYFGVGGTVGMFIDQIKADKMLQHLFVKETAKYTCISRVVLELKML